MSVITDIVARMQEEFGCGEGCGICKAFIEFGDSEDRDNDDRYHQFVDPHCVNGDCPECGA